MSLLRMLMVLSFFLLAGCAGAPPNPPPTVPNLDLDRYMGKWFEIARYEHAFQRGCIDSRATYERLGPNKVEVVNECIKEGAISKAKAKVWLPDLKEPGKLKVSFFWPFKGDYWIVGLGAEYEYALVSDPHRKYLWILSRSPRMEQQQLAKLLEELRRLGFDTGKLIFNEALKTK